MFPWGNMHADDVANVLSDYDRFPHTSPVGAMPKDVSEFGNFDLGGNVHEWCSDYYDAGYYHYSPAKNPRGPASGRRRASRGGSWRHKVKFARCAQRSSLPPEFKYADYGFRVAMSLV